MTEKEKVSKNNGTQVGIKDLFKDLPVRLIEFKKPHKSQFAKAICLMQSYAIISTETRITVLNNQGDSMPFNTVFRTLSKPGQNWYKALSENIARILGN